NVTDKNDISLASTSVLGSLVVNAAGAIDDWDGLWALTVNGLTELSAGVASDITLDNPLNNFNNVLVTRARDVSLSDINNIILGQEGRSFSFSRNLTVDAGGDVTQAEGQLEVSGLTSLRGRNITLNNPQNDFHRLTILSAQSANIEDGNRIDLSDITLTGSGNNSLYVRANIIEQSDNTVIRNENGGGVELRANDYINVKNIDTSGAMGTDSAGGAGGRVYLNAPRLRVGTINTSGGNAASS